MFDRTEISYFDSVDKNHYLIGKYVDGYAEKYLRPFYDPDFIIKMVERDEPQLSFYVSAIIQCDQLNKNVNASKEII